HVSDFVLFDGLHVKPRTVVGPGEPGEVALHLRSVEVGHDLRRREEHVGGDGGEQRNHGWAPSRASAAFASARPGSRRSASRYAATVFFTSPCASATCPRPNCILERRSPISSSFSNCTLAVSYCRMRIASPARRARACVSDPLERTAASYCVRASGKRPA